VTRGLYTLLFYLALPWILLRLWRRGFRDPDYWERIGERLGAYWPGGGPPAAAPLWLHAVSVGEVQAAVPIVEHLLKTRPALPLLITTMTPTGSRRVRELFGARVMHVYAPYDLPGAVARFIGHFRPCALLIMETEIWPNTITACTRRGLPVLLLNARLSEKSAAGYRRIGRLVRTVLGRIRVIAAQTALDAQRLAGLGAPPERVQVTGSVKLDLRLPPSLHEQGAVLRRALGPGRAVWIAASTHGGEEEQVLEAFAAVRREHADALLLLAPRHPDRAGGIADLCRKAGWRCVRRSQQPLPPPDLDIYLADTLGELPLLYAASDLAFVGGSLVPVGGHNMIEPAALGLPVLTGPQLFNFAVIGEQLLEVGAALRVENAEQLAGRVCELFQDAGRRYEMGQAGRAWVAGSRGALERVLALIAQELPRAP
jgi:3-deoxy-D-manno-octulosonic-acid transferase